MEWQTHIDGWHFSMLAIMAVSSILFSSNTCIYSNLFFPLSSWIIWILSHSFNTNRIFLSSFVYELLNFKVVPDFSITCNFNFALVQKYRWIQSEKFRINKIRKGTTWNKSTTIKHLLWLIIFIQILLSQEIQIGTSIMTELSRQILQRH